MNQKTIKEGVVTSSNKKLKGGFNLNQFVLKFLKWIGFAVTTDCCTYFPSFPILGVHFDSLDQVPIGGTFMDPEVTDSVFYRALDGQFYVFNSSPV